MTTSSKRPFLRVSLASVLLIAGLCVGGCTQRFVDYTLLSTKNVDLSKAGTFKRGANRVMGDDKQLWIIFIPTASTPHLKEAVDRAIESVPGAVSLVDGVVSVRGWWFIVGENAIMVEGTPLIDPSAPGAAASLESPHMVSFYNSELAKQENKAVDEETFSRVKELAKEHKDAELSQLLLSLK